MIENLDVDVLVNGDKLRFVRLSKSRALIGNNTVYTNESAINESAITATLNRPNNSKVMFSVS